jgi:hypothetical protein
MDPLAEIAWAWRQALEEARTARRVKDRVAALARARAFVEAASALVRPATGVPVLAMLLDLTAGPRWRPRPGSLHRLP